MSDTIDWGLTTWEGNRRRQHEEFRALSFREKVAVIEQMGEVAEFLAVQRRKREAGVGQVSSGSDPSPGK